MSAEADSRGFRTIRLLAVATITAVGIGVIPSIGESQTRQASAASSLTVETHVSHTDAESSMCE